MHRQQQQQEWGQPPQSHQTQYSSMPQFSSGQQQMASNNYMGSNIYGSTGNTNMPPAFSSLGDQNRDYLQNFDASRRPQATPNRLDSIDNFINQDNSRQQDVNGWGFSHANGVAGGRDSWSQSQGPPQTARGGIPGFATQRSLPLDSALSLSDNSFLNQQPANNHSAPASQLAGNAKIDDSQFVDNMFNSLGDPTKDNNGFLDLNSLSLGGLQQGSTWGSNIGGWGGLSGDSSSFLNNRHGSGFDANNFGNQPQR